MLISKKNVKLSNNNFIDNIYPIYVALSVNDAFTEKGYESDGFKTWKRNDEFYILDKSTGILVTWWKLLGWNVASNTVLRDGDWSRFCYALRKDLQNNNIVITTLPSDSIDE